MRRIIQEREAKPYRGIDDFLARVRPEEDEVRTLIQAGAFGGLYPQADPAELLWWLARNRHLRDLAAQDQGLFPTAPPVVAPPLPPGNELTRLRRQYAVSGFLPERPPMVLFAGALKGKGTAKARDLERQVG